MPYLQDLYETFTTKPIKILCITFLIWVIAPILIFAVGGVLFGIQIISLEAFTNLFSNALIYWWASLIIAPQKFILEYLILFILTLILVHHDILEPIDFKGLVERLRSLS